MAGKPTLVFVPGAWHTPEYFDNVKEKLEKLGYPTRALHNPSCGPEDLPPKGFWEDVSNLRQELEGLSKAGKQVVVLAHSYGGLIAGTAVEGFDTASQRRSGLTGGVIAMGYIAAFTLTKGMTMLKTYDTEAKFLIIEGEKMRVNDPAYYFYSDISPQEQQKWISRLCPSTTSIATSAATYEPWHTIPSTYLFCTADRAIPINTQEDMVSKWGKKANGVTTFTCNAAHVPFLSMPDEVVKAVEGTVDIGLQAESSRSWDIIE